MTQEERLLAIETCVRRQQKITLDEICQLYGISPDTARRDLVKLTQRPGILRVRGGAIVSPDTCLPLSYLERDQHDPIKKRLARVAASLIAANDHILLDTGTSLTAMVEFLQPTVHVVTNSVDIFSRLSHCEQIHLSLLGGQFDTHTRAIMGSETVHQLQQYHLVKAFIGVCGLSAHGLSTADPAEAAVKHAMMLRAQKVILVCEHTKFNQQFFYQIGTWSQIDCVITDRPPPEAIQAALTYHDIELIVVPQEYE
jgi:DeoR/GlpR family transcriptional regulator of sugar metabolism